jgi:ABC-type uncharacterized transport system ATPase subunit
MVHQHFQLVNVMNVAENVVLGEEASVAYQGQDRPWLAWMLRWLPSLVIFAFSLIIGVALGELKYIFGGAAVGAILGVVVAFPALARGLWGVGWRVGLAFVALAIASRIELITEVGFTSAALRHKVETIDEVRPKEMEGYTVKRTLVIRDRIDFDWSSEARQASDAGTDIRGVLDSAKAQIEPYRDHGIPGWLVDGIDDAPPIAGAISVLLLLLLFGWHSLTSWRGAESVPGRLRPVEMAALGVIVLGYGVIGWRDLDKISTGGQVGLTALLVLVLGGVALRTVSRRQAAARAKVKVSPLDGVIDAFLIMLNSMTEIRNRRATAERVRDLSRQYGLEVDPDAVIEKLPVGMQQRVEIVKALYRRADILILDEPTAVLTPQEGRELFRIMRELSAQGVSIIFITHKLKEVFEVATHIVVMRGGRVVGAATPAEATERSLAAMMVGREVILQVEKDEAQPADLVLNVSDLEAFDTRGAQALHKVSFEVRAGEVLGIAGVQGNGQTELVEVLTGLREPSAGAVDLLGMDLLPDSQPTGGWGSRALAFVIDMAMVGGLAYFFGFMVWYFNEETLHKASTLSQIALAVLIFAVVDAVCILGGWLLGGASLGMTLFSLQIVDEHDHKPGPLRLVQRYVIFLLLRLAGIIPAAVSFGLGRNNPQHNQWFDALLKLHVIRRERITPRRIKNLGTSHIPEDRQRYGFVKAYTVGDNLVLNDYYERPFAQEPNLAELPGALLRYLVVAGGIVAILTVLALYVWDHGLWTAILDAYHVPASMREVGKTLGGAQKGALQYPFVISISLLLVAEVIFGIVAHLITIRLLGTRPARAAIMALRRTIWWLGGFGVVFGVLGPQIAMLLWGTRRSLAARRQPSGRMRRERGAMPEAQGGLLRDARAIDRHAAELIQEFDIRTPSTQTDGGNLSGGNQQKMIVAREFSRKPRLLIAAQPTRGIDVGSIEFIHRQIINQRDAGAAVLLVSAELDEIMALSDRIAVLYKGEIIDTLPAQGASREQLGLLMAGIKPGG